MTFQKIFAALSSPDAMAKLAQGANPEDRTIMLGNVEEWRKFSQETSGLIDNVAEFSSQELASRLCLAEPDITLPKIDRQGLVAHFELSSLLFREGAPSLARMLIEEIKAYAGDLARRGNTSPLHVYIDEAGKAVYDGFLELITECRSTGLTITLSTQSPLDFRTSEADVLQAVIQNTATKLFLQQADDESADKCARLTTLTAGQRTS